MPVMSPVPQDHPLMIAWTAYKQTPEYANTCRSATRATHPDHADGCLWAAFEQGWRLATERAGNLHEQINPASDEERLAGSPGAGAMGSVIEYRDLIRS